jgi:hypothetical protein
LKSPASDLLSHGGSFIPLVLGAFLATVSGVIANLSEAYIRRRERERSAALLLGEVLSTLRVLLEGAAEIRNRPPRYGLVTRRMLQAARREMDIYDRNREALIDLREARLRAELHRTSVRISMSLDGILDSLPAAEDDGLDETRDRGFAFMMMNVDMIPALVARLSKVSGHSFDHFDDMPRGPGPGPPGV